ncbi:MAG: hypothetical protein CL413_00510 [Acidimicrobiaceae bacterium]|nr:hypothetical protein [Acidimicrobiaceae bacterium]
MARRRRPPAHGAGDGLQRPQPRPRRRGRRNRWREGCPSRPGWYTAAPVGPRSGDAEGRVSRSSERGYHAAVLEIRVDRPEGADYAQLSPEGELDAYSVAAFREAFAELGEEARLIVNLGGVQFMDSAGLGALIGGIRKVRENEGVIAVFCDRANITRLLHTTGFDRIVPVCEDLPSAIASLDEPPS